MILNALCSKVYRTQVYAIAKGISISLGLLAISGALMKAENELDKCASKQDSSMGRSCLKSMATVSCVGKWGMGILGTGIGSLSLLGAGMVVCDVLKRPRRNTRSRSYE